MDRGLLLTVNYNSTKETIQYIGSLLYLKNINHIDIIIIDNNSNNIIQDKLRHFIEENDLHNIRLICLQDNVGYFGAVRIVMDKYINNINSYNFPK